MLRKTTLSLFAASCMSVFSAYALTPSTSLGEGDPMAGVIAAVNQTTSAVNQSTTAINAVPQTTADKLTPQFNNLMTQLQSIQTTQTNTWDKYVKMQADQQFTGPGDLSSYDFLKKAFYEPIGSLSQPLAHTTRDQFADNMVSWLENNKDPKNINLACKNFGASHMRTIETDGKNIQMDTCQYDYSKNLYYQDDMALMNQTQYTQPENSKNTAKNLLSALLPMGTSISIIPETVLSNIMASRMPGANGEPSMMQGLESTINNLFTPEWENGLAKASPVDVARAQTILMALHDYMQFQQMKMQQEQLLLTVAEMAEQARLNSSK